MCKALFKMNAQGELTYPTLLDHIQQKYQPDSLFLRGIVPYLIMVVCGFIDGCFFYSLFSLISYDSPLLLWVQVAGFLFAFDLVPIFIGIQYRKIQQGLTKDCFTLHLALVVCALACAANIGLRAVTVDILSPNLSENDYAFFAQAPEEEEEDAPGALEWMIAATGMIIPVVTSVGSFVISSNCYDPLQIRKQREEMMICHKGDNIRRLNAMISAYEAEPNFQEKMLKYDEKQHAAAKAMIAGLLLEYHNYARQRLMAQHTGALSSLSDGEDLLNVLEQLYGKINGNAVLPVPDHGAEERKEELS